MSNMNIKKVPTSPYKDQNPGTSGLRKKTRVFMDNPGYTENFIQSVFNTLKDEPETDLSKESLAVGGDGRYLNHEVLRIIVSMAVANGFGEIFIPRGGLISTPAMSAVIRQRKALGGFILTASHNPGGKDGDFGIKYNVSNGGPAPEAFTKRIFELSLSIDHYLTAEDLKFEIDSEAEYQIGGTKVSVIDPFKDYQDVLEKIYDFNKLAELFKGGFRMVFDGMHGVTGIYGHYFLEKLLGGPEGTVIRGEPMPDFGGIHPDPNLVYNAFLVDIMTAEDAPDFGAANDGDGDRNMIFGQNIFIPPGDSVAVITDMAGTCIPGFKDGVAGVARSMPTSTALDRVAKNLGIECYETPTGWKFFCNLMDAGLCNICGEESFGTGADHVREKDGLWAVLSWLSIIAVTGKSAKEVLMEHWSKYGRSYYERHDYEELESAEAHEMFSEMSQKLPALVDTELAGRRVVKADEFRYVDPVTKDVSEHQGLRIFLEDGSRIITRLSGTGTKGATLRFYLEQYDAVTIDQNTRAVLNKLSDAATLLFDIQKRFGKTKPTLIT
jgi:phosphoglucomutase